MIGLGVPEQVKVIALFCEKGFLGDAQSMEKNDGLVVEETVGKGLEDDKINNSPWEGIEDVPWNTRQLQKSDHHHH